jgi:hypothetical protein
MSAPRASALDALLGARIIAPNGKSHIRNPGTLNT